MMEVKEPCSANEFIIAVTQECLKEGLGKAQCAYIIATMEWETNKTFLPVREAYWKNEQWRKQNLRYYPYYGRGLVQLTWLFNYQRYNVILGLVGTPDDLVKNPDVVMRPWVSIFILIHGMKNGVFTGKRIGHYVSVDNKRIDFITARRVVNGFDKAGHIAKLANKWYAGDHLRRYYS